MRRKYQKNLRSVRDKLTAAAREGRLSCPRARAIARELQLSGREIGAHADALGLRISDCELGCFGGKKKFPAPGRTQQTPRRSPIGGKRMAPAGAAQQVSLTRVVADTIVEEGDWVAAEKSFSLTVNDHYLVSLLCSPVDIKAMAVGFLLAEGLLTNSTALTELTVNGEDIRATMTGLAHDWQQQFSTRTLTSGCGHGITFTGQDFLRQTPMIRSEIRLRVEQITSLMHRFAQCSDLFLATGGSHCAALATPDRILFHAEDIGRHNAVDKVLGRAWLDRQAVEDHILLTSGRISGEIMTKVIRARIPVLISRAAPTCMSVTAAEDFGVTLIGFARGRRLNIYSHPQRVTP